MRPRSLLLAMAAAVLLSWPSAPARAQEDLARALARLPPLFGESLLYPRKGKEDIYSIARRYGVSASDLHNANQGDLLAGDELLLIPLERIAPLHGWDGVVVNLSERALYCYRNGRPIKRFPVAIGMRGWETPTGDFTIINRRKNPTWFPPSWAIQEEPVPPGPDNPLGDRWMGLSIKGYGIHATNAPASIGRYVSHGCIRMYPEHAHELYELVQVETPVKIIYDQVALGFRPRRGIVYLSLYPDPYRLGEVTPQRVQARLKEYGLDRVADMAAVARALAHPTGVPTPVVGSSARVLVNGRPVKLALAPTRLADDWLVPAGPLAAALSARIEVGPTANYIAIARGPHRLFFSPGDADALINGEMLRLNAPPQLAAGHPLIPLKTTAMALGSSVGWEEETQTILIWDTSPITRLGTPPREPLRTIR